MLILGSDRTYAYKMYDLASPPGATINVPVSHSAFIHTQDKTSSTTADQFGIVAMLIVLLIICEVHQI